MERIHTEKYQDRDFHEVISLLVNSFESKLSQRQNLPLHCVEEIMQIVWDIKAYNPDYLNLVVKENGKVAATILIRLRKSQKRQKKLPFFTLCRRYGFRNILFLSFQLAALDSVNPDDCYLEHIAVDSVWRGKGLGTMLISYAEELLISQGFTSLSLAVAESNKAKYLYERMGFQAIHRIHSRSKGKFLGISNWVFMRKNLV